MKVHLSILMLYPSFLLLLVHKKFPMVKEQDLFDKKLIDLISTQ
jgi:hypothetical protein